VVKKVYTASNGREGHEIFWAHRHQIDLVISDIEMPEMDGLEMARAIKDVIPLLPVIMITAYSSADYMRGALDLHVDKYLLKPLDLQDLIVAMEQSFSYHELRKLYRDSLTGLRSSNALENDLVSRERSTLFALLRIDEFEKLSDLYGESMARKIVIRVSEILQQRFGREYDCYRTGSNTFALLAKGPDTNLAALEHSMRECSRLLRFEGIEVEEYTLRLHPVTAVTDTISPRALEFGQHALKRTLRLHRDRCRFYGDPGSVNRLDHTRNLQWIRRLNDAIREDRLVPYFQEIVETDTARVVKYEALLRYLDPETGEAVIPGEFLEIARQCNLYPILTRIILDKVIGVIRQKGITASVNIAYADLTTRDTIDGIHELLSRYPDEARNLEFEILESEKIDNYAIAQTFIDAVRPYGCKISIDDFGKGYSNFSILEALHVDYVKIDGSSIRDIDRSQRQEIVVEGIHTFCDKLGIKTVAERVSNAREYESIKKIGIPYAQGWYFSRAKPAKELP